jgi:flavodoxin
MQRSLVVYYSRTGNTRTIAGELVAALRADVDQLDDRRDRCGLWGYLRCAREALKKRTPELVPPAYDPSNYDVVVLGTPVWAGNISSPLRSYVEANGGRLKHVAFFCTQGGSGAEKVFRDLAGLCGQSPLATLAVNGREIEKRDYAKQLERFVATIDVALDRARSLDHAPSNPIVVAHDGATTPAVRRAS